MPVYGHATGSLPALLAEADRKAEAPLPAGDDTAGRRLLGTTGGLGCITCHRWGQRPSLGIPGPDLSNLGHRLQPGWLHDFLINPAAHRPGTLMPSFWPGGAATNREILGGDTARQIASIHSFARSANGEPEGYPDTSGGAFELVPGERPIVQRTFLEDVGTHAILVGFRTGAHVAYDAQLARPALAWRGRFFDAYSTWFSRFAPFEKPAGGSIVKWPPATAAARCDGYRLDEQGVPAFLLTTPAGRVEERFDGIEGGLRRTLSGDAAALSALPVQHPEGVSVAEEPAQPGRRVFTYQWK